MHCNNKDFSDCTSTCGTCIIPNLAHFWLPRSVLESFHHTRRPCLGLDWNLEPPLKSGCMPVTHGNIKRTGRPSGERGSSLNEKSWSPSCSGPCGSAFKLCVADFLKNNITPCYRQSATSALKCCTAMRLQIPCTACAMVSAQKQHISGLSVWPSRCGTQSCVKNRGQLEYTNVHNMDLRHVDEIGQGNWEAHRTFTMSKQVTSA